MNLHMQRQQQTRIIKVCLNDLFSHNYSPMFPVSDWNTQSDILRIRRVTKEPNKMINAVQQLLVGG